MDFTEALKAKTPKKRDELISKELEDHDWDLSDHMKHGGWPENIDVTDIQVDDGDPAHILATVLIDFSEEVPTSCSEVTLFDNYTGATFEIRIDRISGDYDVDCTDKGTEETDEDDDFYPDDYN